jgi:hypothetical protein
VSVHAALRERESRYSLSPKESYQDSDTRTHADARAHTHALIVKWRHAFRKRFWQSTPRHNIAKFRELLWQLIRTACHLSLRHHGFWGHEVEQEQSSWVMKNRGSDTFQEHPDKRQRMVDKIGCKRVQNEWLINEKVFIDWPSNGCLFEN